jgi:hypothetical protein
MRIVNHVRGHVQRRRCDNRQNGPPVVEQKWVFSQKMADLKWIPPQCLSRSFAVEWIG